ncbi:MAG: HEAT repeat domain-containing protein, partial [Pirellulaceae bacterium]|nr:HEAT repeat domain-containing protein [Pirellulaceae bacterium]
GALNKYLIEDDRRGAKKLYIDALARINTTDAIKAMTLCAIEDADEEVRLSCLDHLKKEKRPDVVAYFIRMLRDKDNAVINRAAVALAHMKDPSAIRSLIDVLTTEHEYTFTVGKPGGMGASFGSGGTGLSVGARTETRRVVQKNQAVLDALVVLSGGFNFGFDDRAWRHWHAQQIQREPLDARRD